MKKEIWKHRWAYLILLLGLSALTYLFFWSWPNRVYQRLVVMMIGIFYATWGVVTHTKTQTVTPSVIKEYLGVSLLGVVMLLLITV